MTTPKDPGKRSGVDDVLRGTTLHIYRFLISRNMPVGPREIQRSLNLSSPALATFHLDKLERIGLVSRTAGGEYFVDRAYLKYYIRFRRFLIPRYSFYAALATIFVTGWVYFLFIPSNIAGGTFWEALHSQFSFIILLFFFYGLSLNVILAGFFWYETLNVLRREKI